MTKKTTVLIAILALIAGGMGTLAFERSPAAYAAPRMQETQPPRSTPTNEPQATEPPVQPTEPPVQPTEPPVQPTEPPVQPTEPPVQPTEPPVQPTEESKPTSKPKKPSKSSSSSAPTQAPPAPTTPAVSDSVPSTGFGSVGGWTLGITGLILVCILAVARRLRIGKGNRKGRSDTDGQSINHRHPQE